MRLAKGFTDGFSLAGYLMRALGYETAEPAVIPVDAVKQQQNCSDEFWMQQAIKVAMAANGRANPNPAVGCVLVKDNHCIAYGATETYGGRHAERVALDSLSDACLAHGATLYTTLEPCSHYGKQPPCVDRIVSAGVARCVIAVVDPNPLVNRQGIQILQQNNIEVGIGVCQAEASAWHLPFLHWQHYQKPLLAAKWAQTIDGQLAYDGGEPRWLSNKISRRYAHWLRQRYDAIMVGAGTALNDYPSLTVRDCPPPNTNHPHRILFDPNARTLSCDEQQWQNLLANTFSAQANTIAVYHEHSLNNEFKRRLDLLRQQHHVAILLIPGGEPEPLSWLLSRLTQLEFPKNTAKSTIQSVLLEGGPRLLSQFFARDLVDVAHLFVAPYLGGGKQHRLSLAEPLVDKLNLQLVSHSGIRDQDSEDILIEYIRHDLVNALMTSSESIS